MVEYAEAECETCHALRPKNEMREVSVSRVIGKSTGYGRKSSQSSRRSNSFGKSGARFGGGSSNSSGSRSSSRTYSRVQRVWVCEGCETPKSDGAIEAWHVFLVILAAAAFYGYARFSPASETSPSRTEELVNRAPVDSQSPEVTTEIGADETSASIDQPRMVDQREQVASDEPPQTVTEGPTVDPMAGVAPATSDADAAVLKAQMEHTAELRRQGEEEEARINRQAEEQLRGYAQQSSQH